MKIYDPLAFKGERQWDGLKITELDQAVGVGIHWTSAEPHWHQSKGKEVFVVLSGIVELKFVVNGLEQIELLRPGMVILSEGERFFVSHPEGAVRLLVIRSHTASDAHG